MPNQSPKPTLESVAVLRGSVRGSAARLKRYANMNLTQLMLSLVLVLFGGFSNASTSAAEDAFSDGVKLAEAGDHVSAIAKFQESLEHSPDHPNVLWNLGTSTFVTERYKFAVETWERYRSVMPDDWLVLPKLIQTYQGLGRSQKRKEFRKILISLREGKSVPSLSSAKKYCREQYPFEDGRVYAYEYFEPLSSKWAKFYEFVVVSKESKVRYTISMGSYDATNAIDKELGHHGDGERLYHFDAYFPDNRHSTLGFYSRNKPMEYDEAREIIMPLIMKVSDRENDGTAE